MRPKKKRLLDRGIKVIPVGGTPGGLDLDEVMIKLGELSILSLLIEGGGRVAGSALRAGIVNKMMFFMAPKFLGSSDGIPVFQGQGPDRIQDAFRLNRMILSRFDEDILIEGYLK